MESEFLAALGYVSKGQLGQIHPSKVKEVLKEYNKAFAQSILTSTKRWTKIDCLFNDKTYLYNKILSTPQLNSF